MPDAPLRYPTRKALRAVLDYDPEAGIFFWKKAVARCIRPGQIAGSKNGTGYINIQIGSQSLQAHRLAWIFVYGKLTGRIDHINGNPSDNRISNLRIATPAQNNANMRKRSNTSSNHKGVTWNKQSKKWQAGIKVAGRSIHLGLFTAEQDAHKAYIDAATKYYGKFARCV